jgi:hypothetical protein
MWATQAPVDVWARDTMFGPGHNFTMRQLHTKLYVCAVLCCAAGGARGGFGGGRGGGRGFGGGRGELHCTPCSMRGGGGVGEWSSVEVVLVQVLHV